MPAFQMLKKTSNFLNRNCKFAHFKNSTMRNILLVAILFISSLSFSQEKYNALATPNTYQNADNPNYWKNKMPKAQVAPISALHNFNVDTILDSIVAHLPEAHPFFPKDELTDKPMRFFVSEIVREKILTQDNEGYKLNFKEKTCLEIGGNQFLCPVSKRLIDKRQFLKVYRVIC